MPATADDVIWVLNDDGAPDRTASLMDLSELLCCEKPEVVEAPKELVDYTPMSVTVLTTKGRLAQAERQAVKEACASGAEHPILRFTRKASAEFKQQVDGKKMKSLLAVALNKCPGQDHIRCNGKSLYTTEETSWGRVNTVRWGAPFKG